jgi:uncharacterized protein (DUF2336 family)
MSPPEPNNFLQGQDEHARLKIAQRVGELLSVDELPVVERQAAESLARQLAQDAIERIRIALAGAIGNARQLPRDLALRIAHDIDSVSCPFLKITEVFSEDDWEQLVLTLSRAALVAVAGRASMPEGLALALAKFGGSIVVEPLVDNPATPMTRPVCDTIIDRFQSATWILDKLAQREDLISEVAAQLTTMVSAAARATLARRYQVPDQTNAIAEAAEEAALLDLIRQTPTLRLPDLVAGLRLKGSLTSSLITAAIEANMLEFFAAALATMSRRALRDVRRTLIGGAAHDVIALFNAAKVPVSRQDALWKALSAARDLRKGSA